MKLFASTAALAFAVVCSAPVFAADTTTTAAPTVMLTEEQCKEALLKCTGTDTDICKKDLETKGCKAEAEKAE